MTVASAPVPTTPAPVAPVAPVVPASGAAPVAPPAAVVPPVTPAPVPPTDGATTTPPTTPPAAAPVTPPAAEEISLKFADDVKVDQSLVTQFTATAKELGLKGEAAQKIADTFVKAQQQSAAAQLQAFEQQVKGWETEIRADPELGGAKFDATLATAKAARDRFFPPEVKQLLDQSGLGSHPAIIRGFAKIGLAIAEDHSGGTGAAPTAPDSEEARLRVMYPTMFKKE